MKDNRLKGIIALAVVTVVSFGVIFGSKALTKGGTGADTEGGIDVSGAEGVTAAREITDASGAVTGYAVTASSKGFAGDVIMEISFETDGKTISNVTMVSSNETEGYGAAASEADYLSQFTGKVAPVSLSTGAAAAEEEAVEVTADTTTTETTGSLKDGIYTAQAEEGDNGYLSQVTIKVENGAVTSVVWDAANELGEFKSYLSSTGKYSMTEDGPTWKEQADALAAFVIQNQSTSGITMDENGKTDAVAGVSISVGDFVELTEKALTMAASGEGSEVADAEEGETDAEAEAPATGAGSSEIDGISGATYTTNAVLNNINNAYTFISAYAAK